VRRRLAWSLGSTRYRRWFGSGHHVEDYEKDCMAADAEKQQG
jgi:hypothetical protein